MDTSAPSDTRPQRADAQRNRAKIVAAAREAFTETGPGTQMDDIARRAGLGVGTLYRHFPTKDALLRAIVVDKFERLAASARATDDEACDAWERFSGFLRHCATSDPALSDVLSAQPPETFHQAAIDSGIFAHAERLLDQAKRDGIARHDVSVHDVPLIMCGLGAAYRTWGDDAARRFLEIAIGGLRCGAADDPLPPVPEFMRS